MQSQLWGRSGTFKGDCSTCFKRFGAENCTASYSYPEVGADKGSTAALKQCCEAVKPRASGWNPRRSHGYSLRTQRLLTLLSGQQKDTQIDHLKLKSFRITLVKLIQLVWTQIDVVGVSLPAWSWSRLKFGIPGLSTSGIGCVFSPRRVLNSEEGPILGALRVTLTRCLVRQNSTGNGWRWMVMDGGWQPTHPMRSESRCARDSSPPCFACWMHAIMFVGWPPTASPREMCLFRCLRGLSISTHLWLSDDSWTEYRPDRTNTQNKHAYTYTSTIFVR